VSLPVLAARPIIVHLIQGYIELLRRITADMPCV
jgi:hypothetical protein